MCMFITWSNLYTALYDNLAHALNCTAKRRSSVTSEMKKTINERERVEHAVDKELKRARPTTSNAKDREWRAKFAAEMEEQRKAGRTKSNEKNKARRAHPHTAMHLHSTPNV